MKKLFISILLLSVLLVGCEKTVQLDLNQIPSKVVIEGLVTDQPDMQYVKLSRSLDFYTSGQAPTITDATVTVQDDLGNVIHYLHNPDNEEKSEGYYFPENPFTGEVGRTYKLTVTVDGEVYEATDQLHSVVPIDSLTYGIDEEEFEDPEAPGYYYAVYVYAKEPQETKDYYLFKFLRNNETLREPNEVFFTDDTAIGERIEGVQGAGYYKPGDVAVVQAYSLSRAGFIFYSDMSNLLNSDGGMFGPPPANSRTNISNGGLGFFQASAMSTAQIVIGE